MQKMGVEPTRYCYHTDLNRARLPIPPLLRTAHPMKNHRINMLIIAAFPFIVNCFFDFFKNFQMYRIL